MFGGSAMRLAEIDEVAEQRLTQFPSALGLVLGFLRHIWYQVDPHGTSFELRITGVQGKLRERCCHGRSTMEGVCARLPRFDPANYRRGEPEFA